MITFNQLDINKIISGLLFEILKAAFLKLRLYLGKTK
jgi:hypothetical protein